MRKTLPGRFSAVFWSRIFALSLFLSGIGGSGFAQTPQAAFLSVNATGLAPGQVITLATGPKQNLTAKADGKGSAAFKNLKYAPTNNLFFSLSYQVPGIDPGTKPVSNLLTLDLDPFTGTVNVKGNATRAASIVVNLSAEDSKAMVANQAGYFQGTAFSTSGIDQGRLKILASIINVQEKCCPRSFKPLTPVTITIQGQPVQKASFDLIKDNIVMTNVQALDSRFGVSVPSQAIEQSWLTGFRNFGNRIVEAITHQTASLGSFINAQNLIDTQRRLQQESAQTARSYSPSEALCRFGSLSHSLSASDILRDANKTVLIDMLSTGETAKKGTSGASLNESQAARINQLAANFCDPVGGNEGQNKLCQASKDDSRYNKDIDYTAGFDVPMTLDINFTDDNGPDTDKDEDAILALGENLFPSQPLNRPFNDPRYADQSMLFRSLQAIRSVAKNSFASQAAEKTKGTVGSEAYITSLMASLGVPEAQAKSLMGENPSYFAQMEVLTKKLYQDPAFFVNLMDNPANVERQRASIRAIKLQQGHDFAETIKRREMLLAILLELKIREKAAEVNSRLLSSSGN